MASDKKYGHSDHLEKEPGNLTEINAASVALSAAMAAQKPSLLSKSMFKLYFIMAVGYMVSTMNGFDSSLMGAVNAMKPYQETFGLNGAGMSNIISLRFPHSRLTSYRIIHGSCLYHLQPWSDRCIPILWPLGRRLRSKSLYIRRMSGCSHRYGSPGILP